MERKIVGYTSGVFDLFHIGHLNILKRAKSQCDYLIVAVCSDELTYKLKGKWPVTSCEERMKIVESIRYVDEVVLEANSDKLEAWNEYKYDILFKGDDAKEKPVYKKYEEELNKRGARVQYFPYTKDISTSKVRAERIGKMEINKEKCMSLYFAFRYIGDNNLQFSEKVPHREHQLFPLEGRTIVKNVTDIEDSIKKTLSEIDLSKAAVALSAGMDSAVLASYMPKGTKAYTARCVAESAVDETLQAKKYCDIYGLEHIIVDVSWDDYKKAMEELAEWDGSPIVPNEPQAYFLAKKMCEDGIETIIYGDMADIVFGGMDRLLSKDWTFDEWVERYTFLDAKRVLKNPVDITYVYEKYRKNDTGIDYVRFIQEIYALSSGEAYTNGFSKTGLTYVDPFEKMWMGEPLDIKRIRNGESKYLVRELFKKRFPQLEIPEKLPMSRPADEWLSGWKGPKRPEFIPGCAAGLTGEQKLLVYSLERFLDIIENYE